MDAGIDIVLDKAFADDYGVLKVIAAPGHECDHDVFAQCQFAVVGSGAIGYGVARRDLLPYLHERPLIHRSPRVASEEFIQRVFDFLFAAFARGHHHAIRGDRFDRAVLFRANNGSGVESDFLLQPSADERRFGSEQRNGLALHVRTHQRPVRVVVLQEGNQAGRGTDKLFWRDVHKLDVLRRHFGEVPAGTSHYQRILEPALGVQRSVSLGYDVIFLLVSGEILDFGRGHAVFHHPVGGFKEAVLVDFGVERHGGYEADVRPLGCFYRAYPAVMAGMNVPDLESRPFPAETTRAQGAEPSFVRQLGQGICLVHELR